MNQDTTAEGLCIRLFGNFEIISSGTLLMPFASRNAELLFSFLIMNPSRVFSREILIDKFLQDESPSNSRKRLRTIIWQIRSGIERKGFTGMQYLRTSNRDIRFNFDCPYWLDTEVFETVITQLEAKTEIPLSPADEVKLKSALDLYRGDLLEGECNEWCLCEKERFKMLYMRGIEVLMKHYAASAQWQQAIALGKHLVSEDPLCEHVHRHLMRFHYLAGDRPAALVQYENYKLILRQELGIEPMQKTIALYKDIQNERLIPDPCASSPEPLVRQASFSRLESGLKEISSVASQLEELNAKLVHALELVQEISKQTEPLSKAK